ncbi:MAG: hypothetical protein RR461_03055 [Angelakisella sp.]
MKKQDTIPQPLLRKIILTPLLGAVCLVFGLAAYLGAGDRILLMLSGVLFISCIVKGIQYYRLSISGRYMVVQGTCVRIAPQFMESKSLCIFPNNYVLPLAAAIAFILPSGWDHWWAVNI